MPNNFPHFNNNGCELGDLLDYRPEMKSWCYRVLPLTYDDSLSYYEVLCKNIAMISKALSKDMPEMMNTINCMQNFIQALSSHLNEFIDDYNSNINRIDGELSRIETKFDDAVTRLDAEDIRLDNKIDSEAADIRAKYVKKAGDTMTGQLDMSNNKITNVGAPTVNNDSANKKYVDDKVAALGTVLEYKGTKPNIAALPSTGNKAGDVWYVESEQSAYAWVIDTANPQGHWEEFGPPINLEPYLKKDGSVPMTGNLDMGGHTVTNTAAPTNNTDVANKGYVDTKVGDINRFVLKTGDTMTGSLNMSDNKVTNVKDPTDRKDAVNMGFLIDHVLTEEGGTMISGKISIPFHVKCNEIQTKSQIDIEGTDNNGTYKTLISDGSMSTLKSGGGTTKIIDITSKCGEQQHINISEQSGGVLNTTSLMAGHISFYGDEKGHIENVAEPVNNYDVANKKYVDENGFQGIPVTRDEAYISTPTNVLSTKVLADPTAPPEHPIQEGQVAVYSTTNQTYDPNDVTATLLVADPHSDMEAVNKRTIGGYLSKANINDEFERVTTSKGVNPGTENYRIVSTNTATMGEGRIPAMDADNKINVAGIKINADDSSGLVTLSPTEISISGQKVSTNTGISVHISYINKAIKIKDRNNGQEKTILSLKPRISALNDKILFNYYDEPGGAYIKISDGSFDVDPTITLFPNKIEFPATARGCINELRYPTNAYEAVNKLYVDTNFIKVEGTPQEGSTIAFKNGKWTVVDHTTWNPLT